MDAGNSHAYRYVKHEAMYREQTLTILPKLKQNRCAIPHNVTVLLVSLHHRDHHFVRLVFNEFFSK
jgi:hypothetical protein